MVGERRSNPIGRIVRGWLVLGILAAVATTATCLVFRELDLLIAALFWSGFLAAHHVLATTVGRVKRLRTVAAQRLAAIAFCAYLGLLIGIYAYVFAAIGLKDGATGAETHDFGTTAFFSVITFTTVGYGDVTAVRSAARFFAAMEALNGLVVVALFVAALVPLFQDLLGDRHRS